MELCVAVLVSSLLPAARTLTKEATNYIYLSCGLIPGSERSNISPGFSCSKIHTCKHPHSKKL
jgi:hypothetical protein